MPGACIARTARDFKAPRCVLQAKATKLARISAMKLAAQRLRNFKQRVASEVEAAEAAAEERPREESRAPVERPWREGANLAAVAKKSLVEPEADAKAGNRSVTKSGADEQPKGKAKAKAPTATKPSMRLQATRSAGSAGSEKPRSQLEAERERNAVAVDIRRELAALAAGPTAISAPISAAPSASPPASAVASPEAGGVRRRVKMSALRKSTGSLVHTVREAQERMPLSPASRERRDAENQQKAVDRIRECACAILPSFPICPSVPPFCVCCRPLHPRPERPAALSVPPPTPG